MEEAGGVPRHLLRRRRRGLRRRIRGGVVGAGTARVVGGGGLPGDGIWSGRRRGRGGPHASPPDAEVQRPGDRPVPGVRGAVGRARHVVRGGTGVGQAQAAVGVVGGRRIRPVGVRRRGLGRRRDRRVSPGVGEEQLLLRVHGDVLLAERPDVPVVVQGVRTAVLAPPEAVRVVVASRVRVVVVLVDDGDGDVQQQVRAGHAPPGPREVLRRHQRTRIAAVRTRTAAPAVVQLPGIHRQRPRRTPDDRQRGGPRRHGGPEDAPLEKLALRSGQRGRPDEEGADGERTAGCRVVVVVVAAAVVAVTVVPD
mmetsp:Transcript_17291/g.34397  ORF Transcript_17291/g.34397 Transcript_17291/m.34397 type:complete len:309 (-) Transcript_17291:476-1402(-)